MMASPTVAVGLSSSRIKGRSLMIDKSAANPVPGSHGVPSDYWVCACVKRDAAGNLTAIKSNHPSIKRCRRCKTKKPEQ